MIPNTLESSQTVVTRLTCNQSKSNLGLILLFNNLMQIVTPLISHLRTNPALFINKLHLRHNPNTKLWRHFQTFSRDARVLSLLRQQHLECFEQLLHGNKDARFLGFLVRGRRGDIGANFVWADGVEGYLFFGDDFAVGADETYDSAVVELAMRKGKLIVERRTVSLQCKVVAEGGYKIHKPTPQR